MPAKQMEKEVSEESRSDADENSVDEFEEEFLKQQKKSRLRNLVFLFIFVLGLAAGGFLSWFRSGLAVRLSETEISETGEPDFLIMDKAPDFTIRPPVKKTAKAVMPQAAFKAKETPKQIAKTAKKKSVEKKTAKKTPVQKGEPSAVTPPAIAKKTAETVVVKAVTEQKKKLKPPPAVKPAKTKPVATKAAKKPSAVTPPAVAKKLAKAMAVKAVAKKKLKPQPAIKPAKTKPAATAVAKPTSNAAKQKSAPIKKMHKTPAEKQKAVSKAETVKPAKPAKTAEPAVRQKEKIVAQAKTAVKIAEQKTPGVKKASVRGKSGVTYYLQMGIFSKKKYAQKMGDSLKSLGLKPSYREMTISVTGYSVSAGPYGSQAEADEVVKRVAQKGYRAKAVKEGDGTYRLNFGKFHSGKEAGEAASGLGKLGIKAQVEKAKKKLPATMVVVEGIKGEDELDKTKRILNSKKIKFFVKKSPR